MAEKFDKDQVTKKVNAGIPISREEERFYLLQVLGYPQEVVDNIFAINDNKNPSLIID